MGQHLAYAVAAAAILARYGHHQRRVGSGGRRRGRRLNGGARARVERRRMAASVYIIVCRRQRAGHNHAQKHGVEPDALYQHAGRKAPQRQARVEGHEERGVGRTATVRRHGVHGHGLQRRLNGPEAEAQQHGRQQIARHVVGAHQQHYAAHNGGIARIDQPRLATAVDGAPQRKARGHRGHGYEHKVDAAARQPARGGIDGHIDLDHAIGHHEEELRDGRRRRHGLEQPANAQRRRRKRIAARPDARTHRQRRHRHGRRERKQRFKAAGVHQRQAYGGASAVDMAIDSPNMPRPSPMRLGGTTSVTHVEAALLAAAWNTP